MKYSAGKKHIYNQERIEIQSSIFDLDSDFGIGRANFVNAYRPLDEHSHEKCMEFTYVDKGSQIYVVNNEVYKVESGDVFVTFPAELHGSGEFPQEKSILYYLCIDLESCNEKIIGYDNEDRRKIIDSLSKIEKRLFKGSQYLKQIFDNMFDVYFNQKPFVKTCISNLISELLIHILECEKNDNVGSRFSMQPVLDYIDQNITENISSDMLAGLVNLSATRFHMNFRKQVGLPPSEYILQKKINYAKKILMSTQLSITQIAFELSFSSSQYFSTVFKRFTSMSPSEYRNMNMKTVK